MPPEILDWLWALALWIAVVLCLPKRDLGSLPGRISAVASGNRIHSAGPPGPSQSEDGSHISFWSLLRAETPRAFELGIPVWLVSVVAEVLGSAHRREVAAGWNRTPTGLLAEHVRGHISRRELHKKLLDLGQPLPASKALRALRQTYTTPPMAWLSEIDATEPATADGNRNAEAMGTEVSGLAQPRLEVQTLGSLRASLQGEDLTAKLLRRPTVAFIWQHILARAICAPGSPTSRDWLANELYAGLDVETRRTRLRHQIYNLQQVLQGPLASPIKLEAGGNLMFDLEVCGVDAVRMLELAHRCDGVGGLLASSTLAEVSAALAAASGELLPDWEDLEQSVTAGRGTAGQPIRELRRRVVGARVVLLAALGEHYVASRDPSRAAQVFEEAVTLRPEKPELARKLAAALDSSGQRRRADEVRRSYLEGSSTG